MGEPVFMLTRMPNGHYQVVENNLGQPQLEQDVLELGWRVAFWLDEPDD